MEPSSHEQFSGPEDPHKVAVVSIAISLKRIADAVTYQPDQETLFDYIREIARRDF
jgi:hypothetical protein